MTLILGQPGHHWVEMVDAGMAFGKAPWKTRKVFPKPVLSCSQLPCWESPASGSPAAEGQKLGALHLPVTPEPHTSSGPANSQGTLDPQCPDLPGISPASSNPWTREASAFLPSSPVACLVIEKKNQTVRMSFKSAGCS